MTLQIITIDEAKKTFQEAFEKSLGSQEFGKISTDSYIEEVTDFVESNMELSTEAKLYKQNNSKICKT